MKYQFYIFLFIPLLFLWSCSGDDDKTPDLHPDRVIIEEYLATDSTLKATYLEDLNLYKIPINRDSTVQVLTPGTIVQVYYRIRGLGGVVIDISSPTNGGPAKMLMGESAIYPVGFDAALSTMHVGEKARFLIPSDLAYGSIEVDGLIPKGTILDVELEVVSTLTFTQQQALEANAIEQFVRNYPFIDNNNRDRLFRNLAGGGRYRITDPLDSGGISPAVGEKIAIRYTGKFLSGIAFSATFGNEVYNIGFGVNQLMEGLDLGIGQMKKNERAIILLPSSLAYGASAMVMPALLKPKLVEMYIIPAYAAQVGPFTTLVFEVYLLP